MNYHPFITLVNQILTAKQKDPYADLPERVRSQSGTSAMERQIDQMVYKLYGLTPEEIKIVEGHGKMATLRKLKKGLAFPWQN